jgi:hypothetical protein
MVVANFQLSSIDLVALAVASVSGHFIKDVP